VAQVLRGGPASDIDHPQHADLLSLWLDHSAFAIPHSALLDWSRLGIGPHTKSRPPWPLTPIFLCAVGFSRGWNGSGFGGVLSSGGRLAPAMAGTSSPVPCLLLLSAGGPAYSFRIPHSAIRIERPASPIPVPGPAGCPRSQWRDP
jgi:hypothetical protein